MIKKDQILLEDCYKKVITEQASDDFETKNGFIFNEEVDLELDLNIEALQGEDRYSIDFDFPQKVKIKWFLMLDHEQVTGYLMGVDTIEIPYKDYRESEDNPDEGVITISTNGFDFKQIKAKFTTNDEYRSEKPYVNFWPKSLFLTTDQFELDPDPKKHDLIINY